MLALPHYIRPAETRLLPGPVTPPGPGFAPRWWPTRCRPPPWCLTLRTARDGTVAFAVTAFEQRDCRHENPPPSRCSRSAVRLRQLPLPARRHRAGGALVPTLRPVLP